LSGLLLLFTVVMIAFVIFWSIRNDHVPPAGETKGLLAMRDQPDSPASDRRTKKVEE
jgi:hypothetical protein